ncbi:MAG: hypothetical protein QXV37_00890 [Candidatus Jordarchaeaceae archaeon]
MDPYWFLFNPIVHDLLNLVFGVALVVGIGLLIVNIVKLATSYSRVGPAIGIVIGLLVIGISVKWESVLPIISEAMGGVAQYLSIYLYILIYQWLTQNPIPIPTL